LELEWRRIERYSGLKVPTREGKTLEEYELNKAGSVDSYKKIDTGIRSSSADHSDGRDWYTLKPHNNEGEEDNRRPKRGDELD